MLRFSLALFLTVNAAFAAGIAPAEYQARRATLASEIGPNGMLVVFSARPKIRDNDIEWPFRQSDAMLYLTGLDQPDTTLVMVPGDGGRATVFVRDSNPRQEMWTGHIATHEQVTAISGIADVESAGRFRGFVTAALGGGPWNGGGDVVFYPRAMPAFYRAVRSGKAEIWLVFDSRGRGDELTAEQAFADEMRKRFPDLRFRDANPLVIAMRETKSPAEVALMQKAIEISLAGQKAAMKRVKTAANEREIQALVESTFRLMGACCPAYPSIVASGGNATTLHYEEDDGPIDRHGLLLTDVGAEVEGYAADTTRTYPASGKFSPDQRAIYDAVYVVQQATMEAMRPGAMWVDVDRTTVEVMGAELLKLGLVSKTDPKQVRMYLPYLVGHHIGLAVHDVWDRGRPLTPGMILTDEPGIYVRRDDVLKNPTYLALSKEEQASIAKALERYDGIGVRIEDEVLITSDGPKLLTGAAPRSSAEVERFMAMP
jgi:Xaa-Pro aminopeptidase